MCQVSSKSRTFLSRNEVRFKCDWKRKLFSSNYTVVSEMVVTDGREVRYFLHGVVKLSQSDDLLLFPNSPSLA
ncbi:MAG: hypothetical protein ACI3ZY_01500, partial [Parabacteroides sp.]